MAGTQHCGRERVDRSLSSPCSRHMVVTIADATPILGLSLIIVMVVKRGRPTNPELLGAVARGLPKSVQTRPHRAKSAARIEASRTGDAFGSISHSEAGRHGAPSDHIRCATVTRSVSVGDRASAMHSKISMEKRGLMGIIILASFTGYVGAISSFPRRNTIQRDQ